MNIEELIALKQADGPRGPRNQVHMGKGLFQPDSDKRLRIRVRDILVFFDTKPEGSATHVSSLVAIMGEDLGAALFCEHLARTGIGTARVLSKSPTPGTKTGKRLDRWFLVKWSDGRETLLQAEIKNWSAQAIGGRVLELDPSESDNAAFRLNRWDNQWDATRGCFRHENVGKVFGRMQRPIGIDPSVKIEPLAIYWFALHPQGQSETFFEYPAPSDTGFERIWFFSMSSFLRSISDETLDLDMPNAIARIAWLNRLVEISEPSEA